MIFTIFGQSVTILNVCLSPVVPGDAVEGLDLVAQEPGLGLLPRHTQALPVRVLRHDVQTGQQRDLLRDQVPEVDQAGSGGGLPAQHQHLGGSFNQRFAKISQSSVIVKSSRTIV